MPPIAKSSIAKQDARAEHRWPPAIAILIAMVLSALLPREFHFIPSWVVPSIGLIVLVPLIALNPHRMTRQTAWSRWFSIGFSVFLTLVNQLYLILTAIQLLDGSAAGGVALVTAVEVWVINVIAFGLLYWELDRGGPVTRRVERVTDRETADFLFPQQAQDARTVWQPSYVDYLYFSLSNMMAFSPTDTMPLTTRAKCLMGYQAVVAFAILALVISRAVNILTG